MAESTKLKLRYFSLTTVKIGDNFIVTGQQNLTVKLLLKKYFLATILCPVYVPHVLSISIQMNWNSCSFYLWIATCWLPWSC